MSGVSRLKFFVNSYSYLYSYSHWALDLKTEAGKVRKMIRSKEILFIFAFSASSLFSDTTRCSSVEKICV